ncbi:DUF2027 domain-containing protein [Segatella albensis]|jgi:hypothetical protein|uniref:DUF2027 domain-containing protein n=1 Tax=Segatella albensis TaxID=77768 RepID=UPI0004143B5C|nr:DUF2027 domain-containing protein [Segatella albensis]
MKIGDRVRFLSETGGGKISGFQGKDIVLVEDEDGFEIPTSIHDVVVVEQDDYSMGKMISEKMDAKEKANALADTELKDDSRSIKAILADNEENIDMTVDVDPADKEITYKAPVEERQGGNKLSAYLAFVPKDIKEVTNTRFESYLINDSNYYLKYIYMVAEGNAWTMKKEGEIEPNTKIFIEELGRENLNDMLHQAIQVIAYKKDKPFLLKQPIELQFRIEPIKFFKLHTFVENDFFETPAMLYTIVENDNPAKPLVFNTEKLKQEMYHKKQEDEKPSCSKHTRYKDDGTIVVDLHATELLETTQGMSTADILHYQVDYFKSVMQENKKHRGQKIIFIHGKGEGVLRQAIIHELNYRYKSCTYQDASFQEYGYGATQVTIK